MTVISDTFRDIAGYGDPRALTFCAPEMEDRPVEEYVLTERIFHVAVASDGSFTTPPLAPGDTKVRIGGTAHYITVPDWPDDDPIRLGPLLAAAQPVPPAEEATAVRNYGGIAGALRITLADFAALESIDPDTLYIIPE